MTPNTVDPPFNPAFVNISETSKNTNISSAPMAEDNYAFKTFTCALEYLAYLLIGATVGIALLYAFYGGLPLRTTPMHIVLCVIGYQLLMAVAILSLSPNNGWGSALTLKGKRRVHTVLQIIGSVLAIIGSFVMILHKSVNFNTIHGKFGLVALVFTTVSLVNGLTSFYAFECRRWLSGNLSKLTHICFGTVAFVTASICLCYGFDKGSFRSWASDAYATTLIIITGIFTVIVIINPVITFCSKSSRVIK